MLTRRNFAMGLLLSGGVLAACTPKKMPVVQRPVSRPVDNPVTKLIRAARAQVGETLIYDGRYVKIAYPGGDVPRVRGVCTDVIVRAWRDAYGVDLQELVHEDMRKAFHEYPKVWGLSAPDPNIDHRRVLNLEVFYRRQNAELPLPADKRDYNPGDIVTWRLSGAEPHIGLVSDRYEGEGGRPLVIHHVGNGTTEDDFLKYGQIVGRFRWGLNIA